MPSLHRNGSTFFNHSDWLGTERARTDMTASTCESIASLPFGDGQAVTGTCGDVSPMHFTGKQRDAESGLDDFGTRYNSSSTGRFMSPDDFWKDSNAGDPQSWNKYVYARNNPLRYLDPTGEVATVNTTCTTNSENQVTCDVRISATIAIYAAPNSELSQDQLNAAANTIKGGIENAWNGSFQQDGVTYNVSTAVNVSVVDSMSSGVASGAQNVIGVSEGAATQYGMLADSVVARRGLGQVGPDVGVWNIDHLSTEAQHEFTHILGVKDQQGALLSNSDHTKRPDPNHALAGDFQLALRGVTDAVRLNYSGRLMPTGSSALLLQGQSNFSISQAVKAPLRDNWYRPRAKGFWEP